MEDTNTRDKLGRFIKGYHPPTEFKKGQSAPWKKGAHPITKFKKGHIPWIKDKKHSEETKQKMREARKKYYETHSKLSGDKNARWKGGKIQIRGYIFIKKLAHPFCNKQGYVREHRLIVEKLIKRYLQPTEKVHHRGKKDDNRPFMLMAFTNNSKHLSFEQGGKIKDSAIVFDGRKLLKGGNNG